MWALHSQRQHNFDYQLAGPVQGKAIVFTLCLGGFPEASVWPLETVLDLKDPPSQFQQEALLGLFDWDISSPSLAYPAGLQASVVGVGSAAYRIKSTKPHGFAPWKRHWHWFLLLPVASISCMGHLCLHSQKTQWVPECKIITLSEYWLFGCPR